MDFSLLADRRAPWHGFQGYVGTDNYRSPEHLTRGSVPGLPSDVFTCGLMLYELLAGHHPYWREDQGEYAKLVQAYAAKPPALAGLMPPPASDAEVSSALHRCLSRDPVARPTAAELRAALSGRGAKPYVAAKPTTRAAAPSATGPRRRSAEDRPRYPRGSVGRDRAAGPHAHSFGSGADRRGKVMVRQFGPRRVGTNRHALLERNSVGMGRVARWGTTTETLARDALTAPRALRKAPCRGRPSGQG